MSIRIIYVHELIFPFHALLCIIFLIIGSELGIEIEIRGKQIRIHNNSAITEDKENMITFLRNRTQNFMSKFLIRTVRLEQLDEQLNILREHSTNVAFENVKNNVYILAMRQSNVQTVMEKLFATKPTINNEKHSVSSVAFSKRTTVEVVNHEYVLIRLSANISIALLEKYRRW